MKPGETCQLGFGISGAGQPVADTCEQIINHARDKSIFGYALQEAVSYRDMRSRCYVPRMERTPDEKREILRKFIRDRGLKIARWAKAAAVDKNSIYNFLNEHSQALDLKTYAKLAREAKVPVWKLNGEAPEPASPTTIWVAGKVQAGCFVDAVEWDSSDWYPIDVPVPPRFQSKAKALEVAGASMNLEYREGAIVIWVDMLDYRPPESGDHVIVYSIRHDDQIEATVKEYRVDEKGGRWLWPRSTEPEFQSPVCLENPPAEVREVVIKGIVIGDYRPRVF